MSRMTMDDTSICFINVHLAAGQSGKASRNTDLAAIMEDKAILPVTDALSYVNGGDGAGILDHEIVILSGDLNVSVRSSNSALRLLMNRCGHCSIESIKDVKTFCQIFKLEN